MGYCPLARMKMQGKSDMTKIAEKLSISEPEVAIRWSAQKGYITIPKSANAERIIKNSKVFEFKLSAVIMKSIDALDSGFKVL